MLDSVGEHYCLKSFLCFAVRSSSAHEGKIVIFDKLHCSLTKIMQFKLIIGKINWKD